ncbi:MAG: aminodeoxychorismate/anthranilate synthase component II [Phycisphaerales bacterium]|nr:aminodeoxychorismate/anthranilate synthase component II [Planctomycetota bacterium]MCH8507552.1 aminodeoxychorismate/anthranilate synthase component II [Phycisphaerales bacterium]
MILLIDNYDSFTWNLVQRLGEMDRTLEPGRDLVVVRNDEIDPASIDAMDGGRGPSHILISPGPCTPKEAGISSDVIRGYAGRVPVLGVCLGHQCMADLHGMTVGRHPVLMHGKTSPIRHDGRGVFAGIPSPTVVARYHSLVVARETVPSGPDDEGNRWEVSAWCTDLVGGVQTEVVMGLRRVWADAGRQPLEGVQFHPESFMTPEGPAMLWNFLRTGARGRDVPRPGALAAAAG